MNWLERFKVALIEEDDARLAFLLEEMPSFDDVEEARSAQRLVAQAIALFEHKRDTLAKEMAEIEATRKFLTSFQPAEGRARLDVSS
ncbi:hypothetical protein [Hydrogenimonas sp.]